MPHLSRPPSVRFFHLRPRWLAGSAALALGLSLSGCNVLENPEMMNAGAGLVRAATLTQTEVAVLSAQSCEAMDAQSQVLPRNSAYSQRLQRLVTQFPREMNGQVLQYGVYQNKEPNAWAMANGCVRVYSGLMDLMNDDELRGVVGHEIGHVALGHSTARMRTVYATSAARQAIAASGSSVAAALSQSLAGDLAETFINAQFSQVQETAADNYAYDLLTQLQLNRQGLVTGFQKLSALGGGGGGLPFLSSHPPSDKRAQNIQNRLHQER